MKRGNGSKELKNFFKVGGTEKKNRNRGGKLICHRHDIFFWGFKYFKKRFDRIRASLEGVGGWKRKRLYHPPKLALGFR